MVSKKQNISGIGVDAYGNQVVDPTANVLQLVEAAMIRQDDLREAEVRRQDDLREVETRRMNERFEDHTFFSKQLSDAEAKRIDAIRSVDAQAILTSSEKASAQATVLATQFATSIETLRNLVATTALNISDTLKATNMAITERLLIVERAQYESKGKEGMSEPIFQELIKQVKSLAEGKSGSVGETKGRNDFWGYILGAAGLIAILWELLGK